MPTVQPPLPIPGPGSLRDITTVTLATDGLGPVSVALDGDERLAVAALPNALDAGQPWSLTTHDGGQLQADPPAEDCTTLTMRASSGLTATARLSAPELHAWVTHVATLGPKDAS